MINLKAITAYVSNMSKREVESHQDHKDLIVYNFEGGLKDGGVK